MVTRKETRSKKICQCAGKLIFFIREYINTRMVSITSSLCKNIITIANLNIKDAHNPKKKEKENKDPVKTIRDSQQQNHH
jgi:hypothetical protein